MGVRDLRLCAPFYIFTVFTFANYACSDVDDNESRHRLEVVLYYSIDFKQIKVLKFCESERTQRGDVVKEPKEIGYYHRSPRKGRMQNAQIKRDDGRDCPGSG